MSIRNTLTRLRSQPFGAFVWGVLLRAFFGSLALPLVWVFRPDLFGERRGTLIVGLSVYLLVCLAGGANDSVKASTKGHPESE